MVQQVKEEYLKKLPSWYKDETKYETVLSDDLDGLLSVNILKEVKGWTPEYFYCFDHLYGTNKIVNKRNKTATRVWADVAIINDREKSFDNHVIRANQYDKQLPLMINPNLLTDITNDSYYQKYAGSTALMLWSLYDLPLPKSEEGKMVLLLIDSAFKGYYSDNILYKERNRFYLCDVLGLEGLYEVMERHSQKEFAKLRTDLKATAKIRLNNKRLTTDLDLKMISGLLRFPLDLPKDYFNDLGGLNSTDAVIKGNPSIKDLKRVYTFAYVGKSLYKCTSY